MGTTTIGRGAGTEGSKPGRRRWGRVLATVLITAIVVAVIIALGTFSRGPDPDDAVPFSPDFGGWNPCSGAYHRLHLSGQVYGNSPQVGMVHVEGDRPLALSSDDGFSGVVDRISLEPSGSLILEFSLAKPGAVEAYTGVWRVSSWVELTPFSRRPGAAWEASSLTCQTGPTIPEP